MGNPLGNDELRTGHAQLYLPHARRELLRADRLAALDVLGMGDGRAQLGPIAGSNRDCAVAPLVGHGDREAGAVDLDRPRWVTRMRG